MWKIGIIVWEQLYSVPVCVLLKFVRKYVLLSIAEFVYNTINPKYSNIYKYRSSASINVVGYSNRITFKVVFIVKINSDLGGFASINGHCWKYLEDTGNDYISLFEW